MNTDKVAGAAGDLPEDAVTQRYRSMSHRSEALHARARQSLPGGLTHDSRRTLPYPLYIERAEGSRKWDVDGNEYVDFMGGHGALLFGHGHPSVVGAVGRQLSAGTHFGSEHALGVEWAELIRELMPSAERVRFTNSGTEATLMAVRLARAATGKDKIVRLAGHFHGWHDHLAAAYLSHFDGDVPIGILPGVVADVLVVPASAPQQAIELLRSRGDIAAVILEPTGGSWGRIPLAPELLHGIAAATRQNEALLIFDEVISGFRCGRAGAQGYYGIRPDLTTLAKILAGGLPGGAVVGRSDILGLIDFAPEVRAGREKVLHFGTFNANPLSAAAGIATLRLVRDTDACERANATAAALRNEMNAVLTDAGVAWAVYGTFSGFHVFTNPAGRELAPATFDPLQVTTGELRNGDPSIINALRLAMAVHGVDLNGWPGGLVSAVHDEADIARTAIALRHSIAMLRRSHLLA